MIQHSHTRRSWILSIVALVVVSALSLLGSAALRAGQDSQQGQQDQNQGQGQQQEKPKQGGGFSQGLSKVTGGQSGQETSATASAGAKGLDTGKDIGNLTPSAADLAAVSSMEKYTIPQADLKKFQHDGNLVAKQ